MTELPAGLTVRPPELTDAEAIQRLAASYFQRIVGRPMVTLSEIVEGLTAPTITLERDGWLVLGSEGYGGSDGQVAGYGFVLLGGMAGSSNSASCRTIRRSRAGCWPREASAPKSSAARTDIAR